MSGYADDMALVVVIKHIDDDELYSCEAMNTIKGWLESFGLVLMKAKRKQSSSPSIVREITLALELVILSPLPTRLSKPRIVK